MCVKRSWNYIHFGARDNHVILVSAKRSDGLFVRVLVNDSDQIKLVDGLRNFESYRSCACELNKPCEKHKEKK